ncbi:MAG TPA: flagellar basal body P-ring protein FlgI [Lacipirellulaceae bacterium]|nr:flagellar basal body P-ring protein FlgI [Lacipirellulaceae bacterium]
MTRRTPIGRARRVMGCVAAALVCAGCSGPILRPQSPEARLDLPPMPDVKYVSEYTHPYGMNYVKLEGISLLTGLRGTGSDPPPNNQRALLLAEMNRRGVDNPNELLASGNVSMVLVRAFLRPGIQEGDRFDVEVRVPTQSETTSIRNGWLLSTRLTELAVLGEQIREGHLLGLAEGPVLVDPSADPETDEALATRGRILGGGVALKSRPLGLVINHQNKSVRVSQDIATSINRRFHTFVDGRKQGVATPKTDEFIDLLMHPRYKDNIARYIELVHNVAINELPAERQARLLFLEQQLADPLTAANAAIRLEAIGDDEAIAILKQGLSVNDPEVRFYAAEALAYLDETSAVDTLADVARNEPAFRVNALAALSAMDDVMAYDALRSLLETRSAETRYGAFRALWAMNQHDPFLRHEKLGDAFHYHVLEVPGPQMVHVTRSHLPEIVLFGKEQQFELPLVLDAGNILVNGMSGERITVSRFSAGSEAEQRVVSTRVDEVIRAIVELGGTYPDVVQALQQAKTDGALASRFEVDALPQPGRPYDRDSERSAPQEGEALPDNDAEPKLEVATPQPDLYGRQR